MHRRLKAENGKLNITLIPVRYEWWFVIAQIHYSDPRLKVVIHNSAFSFHLWYHFRPFL